MFGSVKKIILCLFLIFMPAALFAASGDASTPHLDGSLLSFAWIIPFVGMILSIAIMPLVAPHFWHDNFGRVSVFWALCFLVPFALMFGFSLTLYEILHTLFLEYIPFIILIFALYTVSGGIRLVGRLRETPLSNTVLLAIGTVIASLMGTTGAAMLLIRPLLNANEYRKHKVHTVVFFIFLVANIGGALSPLGDPPLFLGYLQGVPFEWPLIHLFAPMAFLSSILLVIYFFMDRFFYVRENKERTDSEVDDFQEEPVRLRIEGKKNLFLVGGIVAAVLLSGVLQKDLGQIVIYHIPLYWANILRDLSLIGLALLSLKLTDDKSRLANGFSWFPVLEVGKLFIGIFITLVPVLAILKAGENGILSPVISMVTGSDGAPMNLSYFWVTGILSSFLDNAPTYLVFFNTAGATVSDGVLSYAQSLTGPYVKTLVSISAGAVFMGAVTYIGNAPNFMVRAIAEERGVKMPSFFGYILWSGIILMPLFALLSLVFFLGI